MFTTQEIARVAHETNRAYCASTGDDSQVSWEDAPDWQKSSAIQGVRHLIDHPDATPADMHENWLQVKVDDGWCYGPVKDEAAKTHPACVPYSSLPQSQQSKDYVFSAVVKTMLAINVDRLFAALTAPQSVAIGLKTLTKETYRDRDIDVTITPTVTTIGRGHLGFGWSGNYYKIVPAGSTIKLMTLMKRFDGEQFNDYYEVDKHFAIDWISTGTTMVWTRK